jgi:hypothetical protein
MKLEIVGILERGVSGKERLHLRALADTTLSFFVVFATEYTPTRDGLNRFPTAVYWFPPKPVKAGDHVVLLTGMGADSERKNDDGTTSYFFYWNRPTAVWNQTGKCATLFEMSNWMTSRYE